MGAESLSPTKQIFNHGLTLYRRTLKRWRWVHRATHWGLSHTLIPFLEASRNFHTLADDPFWFRLELLTGQHEAETTALIRQHVQAGMTVLDVGAHVGYYSRLLSQLVGDKGRVIAFEPHPRNRETLLQNTHHLANVTVIPVAAAEQAGTAQLYDYLMMSASGSLHYDEKLRDVQRAQVTEQDHAPRLAENFTMQTFTVPTAPIDTCLQELGISAVDFVKMDIEGAELGALLGMRQTITQSPRLGLVMEYNPLGLQAFGHQPEAALDTIMNLGFRQVQHIHADATLSDLTDDMAARQHLTQTLIGQMGVANLLLLR